MFIFQLSHLLQAPGRVKPWSMAANLGSRWVESFAFLDDYGTANMTDDGGAVISQIKGRKTGMAFTAAGGARGKWVAGKGILFNNGTVYEHTGTSPLFTGSDSGSIVWVGVQLALDGNPRNLVSIGTSGAQRSLRTNAASHRPGAITTAVTMEDTGRTFAGLCVLRGKFSNGRIYLWFNGEYCGSADAALATGTGLCRFGASLAGVADRFAIAYFRRVDFINGETSLDEDRRIDAEVLGADAYDVLPEGHPYRPQWKAPTFFENITAINALIAAKPSTTPDQQADMASPPSVTAYAGAPNSTDFPIGADVNNERRLLTLRQGWPTPDAGSYYSAPMGLLGMLGGPPPVLFAQTTSFRAGARITSRYVALHVYGVSGTQVRLAVKQSGDPCPLYVARAGHTVAGPSGSNTIVFDFGTVAERECHADIPGSNMFGGFYTEAGGIVEPLDPIPELRVGHFSDSFGSGTGASQRWNAFSILLGDRLNLTCGQFAGNVGGGWEADSSGGGIYPMSARLNDVTDADLTERRSLGITALSRLRAVFIYLGVNDAPISHTAAQWQAIIQPQLQVIRNYLPWAPIICVGPWDRYHPSAVNAGWRAVDDGLRLAVAQISYCTYLSMEGVPFDQVGGGNIHPVDSGHTQIAVNLAPRIEDALLAMAATFHDADTLAWRTAVLANGGTVSWARLAVVNAFIAAEKASGAWALTDDYWALWGENATQALTSLKQRRLATTVNSPTFTADRQYAFDGAANYVNTGFVPSTHGIAYTGNVQRLAAYERTNVTGSGVAAGTRAGSSIAMSLNPRSGTSMTGAVNNTAGGATFAITPQDSRGYKALSRAGGTTALGYDRGARKTDVTGLTIGSSSAPSVPLFIGAFDSSNTPISFRPASVGFVAIGAPLSDAQELAQYNAVQAWATAIGANV